MTVRKRQTNVELLRILSMFLIVVLHYFLNVAKETSIGSINSSSLLGGVMYLSLEPSYILSGVGVNCFVMITGYFICQKEFFRWKGIIRTWTQTAFYILSIGVALKFILPDLVNIKLICKYLLLDYSGYWFVTCYIGLLLVAPLLAIIINSLNERNYQIILVVLFILSFQYAYGRIFAGYATLGWFIFLFMVAGYIRKFSLPNIWINHKKTIFLFIWILLFVLATSYNIFEYKFKGVPFRLISSSNDGMMFFLSLSLFVYFINTKMENKYLQRLSKLSPYVFGVYLIHNNPFCFKQIWLAFTPEKYNMPIIVHCILVSSFIFIACITIDYIRSKIFNLLQIPKLEGLLADKLPNLKFQES